VKRVAGGAVSTHLTTALSVGAHLEVLGPSGSFVVPEVPAPSHVVLLGGGSGITPLFAIARSLLADPDGPRVSLLYGNRAREDVIFADALDGLAASHPLRFTVFHALERGAADWSGRLDETAVHAALGALPDLDAALYFLCGPAPMRAAARRALEARGVDARRVREEVFSAPHAPAQHSAGDELVTLRVRGAERAVTVRAGETILDAATRAGVAMPYSCAVGGCGACQCRRVAGEVVMEEPNCLDADEREAGQVLTCVGRPGGAGVVLEVP
jgi:ferredoxin-NADP reductase